MGAVQSLTVKLDEILECPTHPADDGQSSPSCMDERLPELFNHVITVNLSKTRLVIEPAIAKYCEHEGPNWDCHVRSNRPHPAFLFNPQHHPTALDADEQVDRC